MGRGGGSSGRAGVSTPSGRVAQSPTEQAWTVTQHQGPARSGRARGGHQVPVGTTGAITPRLSPLPALPERIVAWASAGGHGRQRSHGPKQRAHRSLQNRKERGFAQHPQPSSSSSSRSTEKIRCSTASQVSSEAARQSRSQNNDGDISGRSQARSDRRPRHSHRRTRFRPQPTTPTRSTAFTRRPQSRTLPPAARQQEETA